MSTILYYSNFCENSKNVLSIISKHPSIQDDINFICIDKRINENNKTYIIFQNGEKLLLPPSVTKVPALLLLNRGNQVLFGDDILKKLSSEITVQKQQAQNYNGEPSAYAIGDSSCFGVTSDSYSFLDQDADELKAQGNGGMRQSHHYMSLAGADGVVIETPPDLYTSNKIGNVSMEQLQQKRNMETNIRH